MDKNKDLLLRELRCVRCRAFITYERIIAGVIWHRCPKCGHENHFDFKFLDVPSVWKALKEKYTMNNMKKGGEK